MSQHTDNGRYWAAQALARRDAGDAEGFAACLANAKHYAQRAIAEGFAARQASATRDAQRQRAWNGGGRGR